MLGAFFIATEPVSAASTLRGRFIYGAGNPLHRSAGAHGDDAENDQRAEPIAFNVGHRFSAGCSG